MKRLNTTLFALSLMAVSGAAGAVVSDFVPIQGVLTDPDTGAKIDGAMDATFSIYNAKEGGVPLWTVVREGANQLLVQDGFFTVYLGKVAPLDLALLLSEAELFVGITVGDTEMQPRLELSSGMFSMESQYCSMADNFDVRSDLTVTGGVTVGGSVTVSGEYEYAEEKTGVLAISAVALRPANATIGYEYSVSQGLFLLSEVAWESGFFASVSLPNGVTVTALSANGFRNAGVDISCELRRASADETFSNQSFDTIATASFSSMSAHNQNVRSTNIANPVVDNSNYNYYLQCVVGYNDDENVLAALHDIRIEYVYFTL
jgi:hypothetical protein